MKPRGKSVYLVIIFAILGIIYGCFNQIRSTGAILPQTSEEFGGNSVRITLTHNCSANRCKNFKANFENLLDEPLEINYAKSSLTRAGVSMPLAMEGAKPGQTTLTIPPHGEVSASFFPVSSDTKKPYTYVRTTSVWCSVKIDGKCTNTAKAEAKCAGMARYYYDRYVSTGGWIKVGFVINAADWPRPETYESMAPGFVDNRPSVVLDNNNNAPSWLSSSGESVIYRISCDAQCKCKDISKPHNFETDERFEPVKD